MRTILIIYLLCLIGINLVAQNTQKQSYNFESNDLVVKLISYKTVLKMNDTLNVEIQITNNSTDSILVFDEKLVSAVYCSNCNIVTIDYGQYFDGSIETEITMLKIKKYQSKVFNLKIPYHKLIEFYKNGYVNLDIGIGYIKDIANIKRHENPSLFETKYFNDKVKLSSIIVELMLIRLNVGSLKFTLE